MRFLLLVVLFSIILMACGSQNNGQAASQPFCDTSCSSDTFLFTGNHRLDPSVSISVENCTADTITWNHGAMPAALQMHMGTLLGNLVRLNESALNCYIKDTSYAWVTFNDCLTGRGYLLYLPFSKAESVRKMSSALNSFDKKFAIAEDLRAYCDYSTVYVENIKTGERAQMTFKEEYKIDFNNIHQTIDSANITPQRIFVQLIKNGQKVPLEKTIDL